MSPGRPTKLLTWAQGFFFFSGATGLIYQVLWTRRLTLTFGHTVLAISTVLTAFMAGLALGSFSAGVWTDREAHQVRPHRKFLADYGYLEAFIGLWALLTIPLLNLAEAAYTRLASSGVTGLPLSLACFGLACLILIPPTTAMGATLPILTRLLTRELKQVGPVLSRLYGINTLGALAGAGAGGFFLLPLIGLKASMILAALINGGIAAGALKVAADEREPTKEAKKPKAKSVPQGQGSSPGLWLVPLSFGLAGFSSMTFQVGWNRSVCLAIGSSVYAFSTILVIFLGGLALGSLLYQRLFRSRPANLTALGLVYSLMGLSCGLTLLLIPLLPRAFLHLFPLVSSSFFGVLGMNIVLVTFLLLPPTLLMGLGFPLATAVFADKLEGLGRTVGIVYSANTLGCILGAFVTGFILIPELGAQTTMVAGSLLYFGTGLAVLLKERAGFRALLLPVASAIAVLLIPQWNTGVLASGTGVYANDVENVKEANFFNRPAIYLDGLSSAVAFALTGENWDTPNMRVNGKVDASRGKGDRLTQYLLGYLPTLLHPSPSNVGIIGLGGGFTVEAVAQCPGVQRIQVAELEPAVVEIAEYWKPFNSRVLEDPRVEIHINDGRTFVLASRESFDVLISEPSNPWIAGIGNLFTLDFYERCRARLTEDGLMCQWFNLYAINQEDLKMVVRSFYEVFPEGHLWQSSGGDLILIGSASKVELNQDKAVSLWSESLTVQRHFFESELFYPGTLPGHFLMTREEALAKVGTGPFNTDDRPLLEFSAPFSLYDHEIVGRNQAFLRDGVEPRLAPGVQSTPDLARLGLYGLSNRDQWNELGTALQKLGAHHPDLFILAADRKLIEGDKATESARRIYQGCLTQFPEDSTLAAFRWAELEYKAGNYTEATNLYLKSLESPIPGSRGYIQRKLGQALFHQKDYGRALKPLLQSSTFTEYESTALSVAGGALVKLGRDEEALEVLKEALRRNPQDPLAHQNVGFAKFNLGKPKEAKESLQKLLELSPNYWNGWLKLGHVRAVLGDDDGAVDAFKECLRLNPQEPTAYEELKKRGL